MTEQSQSTCDAITARLWECLPRLLEDLPEAGLRGRVSEELVQELGRRLSNAIMEPPRGREGETTSELAELAAFAFDIERSLQTARGVAADLSDELDMIASRACDAERSLRMSQSWVLGLDDQLGRIRSR